MLTLKLTNHGLLHRIFFFFTRKFDIEFKKEKRQELYNLFNRDTAIMTPALAF